jgi:hypothetical protein
MINSAIDRDTVIKLCSVAATWQGEALRWMMGEATQQALPGRASMLANVRKALSTAQATSTDAAQKQSIEVDLGAGALSSKAFASTDAALLQTVQTNRHVLQQLAGQGTDLQETCAKSTLASIERWLCRAGRRRADCPVRGAAARCSPGIRWRGAAHSVIAVRRQPGS